MPSTAPHPAVVASDRALRAVMAGNRDAWLDCFSSSATLRDPVGGSPLDPRGTGLQGRAALGRFWDQVIANVDTVEFKVREEHPSGNSTAKVADVRLTSPGGHVTEYSGVFVYELDDTGLIQTLSGYFTFPGLG